MIPARDCAGKAGRSITGGSSARTTSVFSLWYISLDVLPHISQSVGCISLDVVQMQLSSYDHETACCCPTRQPKRGRPAINTLYLSTPEIPRKMGMPWVF